MCGRKTQFVIVLCLALRVVCPANATVSFRPPVSYPVGVAPAAVVAADFNADGNPDLAVANSKSGDLSILLRDGDGTFREAMNFDAGMPNPQTLVAGDFNKDGKMDLAVLQPGMLSVLLGMGDGSFQSPKTMVVATASSFMVVADFNVDKTLDIAVSNFDPNTGAASIEVFLGNGDGSFQSAKQVSILSGGPLSSAAFAVGEIGRAHV